MLIRLSHDSANSKLSVMFILPLCLCFALDHISVILRSYFNSFFSIFAALCYTWARYVPSCGVCPSVRLSVMFLYCVKTSPQTFFTVWYRPTIFVFRTKRYGNISTGTPCRVS